MALTLLLASSAAFADGAAVLRCRQVGEPTQRFACYEAIAVPGEAAATAPKQQPQSLSLPVPVRPPSQPAAALPAAAQFGLDRRTSEQELQVIESRIQGRFNGWEPNDRIVLANDQVWQITDDSRGALVSTDPKVKVRRGALGAYYLEIEGTNRSPKVRRIK